MSLPDKWLLKITEENRKEVNNWRTKIVKYKEYDCAYPYIDYRGVGISIGGFEDRTEITYEEFEIYVLKTKSVYEKNDKNMKKLMLDILEKTYDNPVLRQKTVPLFMSNPGMGKTTIIKEFAKSKKVNLTKITLSQRMPNEVVGMMMPNTLTGKLEVYDSYELSQLKDGDILFFDEVFNGTLKQTLDAVLNLLEDRSLPSGKKLADVFIVAASNPQGLINLTPQIKERFIRYDLKFNAPEYCKYLKDRYGIPESISKNLCTLINKEKFDHDMWNFCTPRSIEKAINQIGCDLESAYDEVLMPYLKEKIKPTFTNEAYGIKKGEEIEFLTILKEIVKALNKKETKNDSKNSKQKVRTTSNIPG